MLTEAQWALLEPLIEACRPPAKVAQRHLRRTISAILWRHTNGAKWRAIPDELGPWWMAAQLEPVEGGGDGDPSGIGRSGFRRNGVCRSGHRIAPKSHDRYRCLLAEGRGSWLHPSF